MRLRVLVHGHSGFFPPYLFWWWGLARCRSARQCQECKTPVRSQSLVAGRADTLDAGNSRGPLGRVPDVVPLSDSQGEAEASNLVPSRLVTGTPTSQKSVVHRPQRAPLADIDAFPRSWPSSSNNPAPASSFDCFALARVGGTWLALQGASSAR